MKYKILLVALSAALVTGCSTAYRAGQTPDDVYFSPGREVEAREEVRKEIRNDDRYETYTSSEDDNYLRMRIRNRNRWSSIDDFDYWYNPYNSPYYSYSPYGYRPYGYNPHGNSLYFSYNGPTWNRWGYNSFNNYGWMSNYNYYGHGVFGNYNGSFYPPVYVIKNTIPANNNVSRPSLGSYRNSNYNNNNTRRPLGESLNKVFSPSQPSGGYNNSNNNSYSNSRSSSSTYEAPARTYNPPASTSSSSSSAGSSSSSTSGSSGSVRPPR